MPDRLRLQRLLWLHLHPGLPALKEPPVAQEPPVAVQLTCAEICNRLSAMDGDRADIHTESFLTTGNWPWALDTASIFPDLIRRVVQASMDLKRAARIDDVLGLLEIEHIHQAVTLLA
jgi:hypothetical protein